MESETPHLIELLRSWTYTAAPLSVGESHMVLRALAVCLLDRVRPWPLTAKIHATGQQLEAHVS